MSYDQIPSTATLKPAKFTAHVSDQELSEFKQLLKLSKVAPETYENSREDRLFGVSRKWIIEAKARWENGYDWRKTEARINALPQFKVQIEDIDLHFMALFSTKTAAPPVVLSHGWPGSFLEFLKIAELLKSRYKPEELPISIIVPSLPGYGYSSGPPTDRDYRVEDIARVVDKLMTGLGFDAYVAQGGDIGSYVSRVLGGTAPACKAVHLNFVWGVSGSRDGLTEQEQWGLRRGEEFESMGNAYVREQGTRPGTIGLVLASSPIAVLAWIGEKFQQWTDQDPPLDEILDSISLYWFTESFPRCIYPYREFYGVNYRKFHPHPDYHLKVPFGYSYFPWEISPIPRSWAATSGNLVWYRQHDKGGHFAAMERPEDLSKDILDFVAQVWETAGQS